jgi:uncharacterized membrane protein YphA (DoxX/SURF4 family)
MEWFFRTDGTWQNLIIRVSLGAVMFPHGAMKLLGWFGGGGVSGTLAAFAQYYHVPAAMTLLAIGIALALMISGGGSLSFDRLIARKLYRPRISL